MSRSNLRSDRITLRQLKLAVALDEQASVLRAARSLGMSQPAATKLLADLEHESGGPLFVRSNRGVLPNARGEAMIRHARMVLSQVGSAIQELSDMDDGTGGSVSVGCFYAASATLLPRAIAALRRARPKVSITVTEGGSASLFPLLERGELDFVVGRVPEHGMHADIVHEILYRETIGILVRKGHRLSRKRSLKLTDLLEEAWLLPPPETAVRQRLDLLFRDAGLIPPKPAVQSISVGMYRRLLLETDMLAVLSDLALADDFSAGLVTRLPIELPSVSMCVLHRAGTPMSPAGLALVQAVRAVARQ
jgi:DNA-binding transcriptional LysR family regulator